ncbi:MAG: VOC family protein [Gammaproteobacteria bacterium]
MQNTNQAIPAGYHSLNTVLVVRPATDAIEFYKSAFGAIEMLRVAADNGKLCYAELRIGDSALMLNDEFPEMNVHAPHAFGGSPASIYLFVENVDATFANAVKHGATIIHAVEDKHYGDRSGTLEDPFGHRWHIATRINNAAIEELKKNHCRAMCENEN